MTNEDVKSIAKLIRQALAEYVGKLPDDQAAATPAAVLFVPAWKQGFVKKGERRSSEGKIYAAVDSAMSETKPADDPTLWKELVASVEEYPIYDPDKTYYKGDKIAFEGKKYVCIYEQGAVNWDPVDFPEGWQLAEEGNE